MTTSNNNNVTTYKSPSSLYYGSVKLASPAETAAPAGPKPTGVDLYARFSLAGALCCAVSNDCATVKIVVI